MARADDAGFADWIAAARATRIEDAAAARGAGLRRVGAELVGPCPACGGTDRFGINLRRQVFHCRGSGRGGDVIEMVQYLDACDFIAACTALAGEAPSGDRGRTDEAERQRRAEARAAAEAESERIAIDYREAERRKAYALWRAGTPLLHSAAEAYLDGRSLIVPAGAPLRCLDACPYWHPVDGRPTAIHTGPALLAAITDEAGRFAGVHMTWIDPDHPGRKAAIVDPAITGTMLPAKKIRGSKRRGAIRLADPPDARRLVIGEGIETTLSVFTAELPAARPTAYWAAIDLGHLGGKAAETVRHPTLTKADRRGRERPVRVPGPVPELQPDRDLMPPERFTEIVILGDGDSDRFTTEQALRRAAARWRLPGRTVRIAWAPEGRDFNDVLREA